MKSHGVSPAQGQEPLAKPGVNAATSSFSHSPRPVLFSQFRGPFVFNETDEERKNREDKEKQTNFDKVREKAEREEAARKKAEEERDALLKEKQDREAEAKKQADAKLEQDKKFEELAAQRETEAKAKADEAAREKKRADDAEARLKQVDDEKEAELLELLKEIPEDKRPQLDPADSVSKRIQQVKHTRTLLQLPKDAAGTIVNNDPAPASDRKNELLELSKKRPLTSDENLELMGLDGD